MISRKELLDYKTATGFNALGQLEKDYLQHLILLILGDSNAGVGLVFKGGTCLQKCFGLARFSEDLDFDFTLRPPREGVLTDALEKTARLVSRFGYEAQLLNAKKQFPQSRSARLSVRGPLYDGTPASTAFVTIEIRFDKPALPPVPKTVTPPYADLRPYSLQVLDLRELFAEKVRALYTRSEPRDLYDLNYLITKFALVPDRELIQLKLDLYGERFSEKQLLARARRLEKNFEREMLRLSRKELIPDFAQIIENIRGSFEQVG